ncbi:MAG: DUF3820 family protein [Salinivirgaceae bacterium]|nr:DUF3820 family protein [Salinivirgaceae bacterium]
MEQVFGPSRQELIELANTRMPFGKYKGRLLIELPEPYLVWYRQQGFPAGKLGAQLQLMYEVKLNGLEKLIWPMVQK